MLGNKAGIAGKDESENEALQQGEFFIAFGRYLISKNAVTMAGGGSVQPGTLIAAYHRLFQGAEEKAMRVREARRPR